MQGRLRHADIFPFVGDGHSPEVLQPREVDVVPDPDLIAP